MEPGLFLRLLEGYTVRSLSNRLLENSADSNENERPRRIEQVAEMLEASSSPPPEQQPIRLNEEEKTRVARNLLDAGLTYDQVSAILSSVESVESKSD